jgi:hypothetical protein
VLLNYNKIKNYNIPKVKNRQQNKSWTLMKKNNINITSKRMAHHLKIVLVTPLKKQKVKDICGIKNINNLKKRIDNQVILAFKILVLKYQECRFPFKFRKDHHFILLILAQPVFYKKNHVLIKRISKICLNLLILNL